MNSLKYLLCTIGIIYSNFAVAGVRDSGGGFALVCRSDQGNLLSAELLDLYEARVRYSLSLPHSLENLKDNYARARVNTDRLQADRLPVPSENLEDQKNLARFFRIAHFTQGNERLPNLADLGNIPDIPSGCAVEPLAVFYDSRKLVIIDSEIWQHLDSMNRAALVYHEVLYQYQRALNEETSENTRAFVAHVFSDSPLLPVNEGRPSDARLCLTGDSSRDLRSVDRKASLFYIYEEDKVATLQFEVLMGRPLLVKALAKLTLPSISNSDLRVPIEGGYQMGWEVGLHYELGELTRLSLFEQGRFIEEAEVSNCN